MSLEENGVSRRKFIEGLIGGVLAANTGTLFARDRKMGKEVKMIMSPEEVEKYMNEELNPRVTRIVQAPNQIPGIQNRLEKMIRNILKDGKMIYSGVGGYHPYTPNSVAHLDYNVEEKKPVLFVYVPAMQKMVSGLKEIHFKNEEIDLIVAMIYAHEQIHYENSEVEKKYPPLSTRVNKVDTELSTKEEAEAWGITVLEMIRPALEKGFRLPQRFIEYSETLKKAGDDYHSSKWINYFKDYHKAVK